MQYFEKNPHKKLFFISHSCGGAILKTALEHIHSELRDRIIVNNMGGGAYIPKSLCKEAVNYISLRDHISVGGNFRDLSKENFDVDKYTIRILEPNPGAPLIDHTILSPTYQDALKKSIAEFIKVGVTNVS